MSDTHLCRALQIDRLDYLPGQLIVRVRSDAVRPGLESGTLHYTSAGAKALPAEVESPFAYLRKNAGLKGVHPLFSKQQAAVERASVSDVEREQLAILSSVANAGSEDLTGLTVVSVDPSVMSPELLRHLGQAAAVEFAEPMPARWLAGSWTADPVRNLQWGLRAIRWFEAPWVDASQVGVGVMDTGIDRGHPDLLALDSTYRHGSFAPGDPLGHGTHVAGTLAATANNAVGIAGVTPCRLTMWKVFPDQPWSGSFYVDGERYLRALHEATTAGVRVLNLSLGGTASSQTEAILFRRLREHDVVVVAAMGNEYQEGNPVEYPAAYDGVLAVGAVAETLRRSTFSNTGEHIGLVAPGSDVLSTLPRRRSPYRHETDYGVWSGTSMAAPHVAGAAALAVARFPAKSAAEIREHLLRAATLVPRMRGKSWTKAYGSGLLNLERTLR